MVGTGPQGDDVTPHRKAVAELQTESQSQGLEYPNHKIMFQLLVFHILTVTKEKAERTTFRVLYYQHRTAYIWLEFSKPAFTTRQSKLS